MDVIQYSDRKVYNPTEEQLLAMIKANTVHLKGDLAGSFGSYRYKEGVLGPFKCRPDGQARGVYYEIYHGSERAKPRGETKITILN